MSYLCCESQTRSITPSPVSHSSTFQLKVLNGSVVVRYLLSSFLLKYKSSATRHLNPGGKDLFTSSSDAAASAAAVSSLPWSSPVLNSTVSGTSLVLRVLEMLVLTHRPSTRQLLRYS